MSLTWEYTLAASATTWGQLRGHLAGSQAERMAFGYCSAISNLGKTRLLLHEVEFPTDGEYAVQHSARVVLSGRDTIPYLIRAKGAAAFLDAHSHPFPGVPHPSLTDNHSAARQHASLQGPAPGAALVRIISSADGRIWAGVQTGPEDPEPIRQVHILGRTGIEVIVPVNSTCDGSNAFREMDRRTLACLGDGALSKTRGLAVGLIGVGGVGSMVARLLASVVGELILVDPDHLEPSNAPRVWYAGTNSRGSKVGAARRAIRRAFPHLEVRSCVGSFPSRATNNLLAGADFLFVCPDHNAVRFSASRFAAENLLPLIEVGCGGRAVDRELSALGYHVRLQVPGGPCLPCNGLDVSKLEDPSTTEAKKQHGYIEDGSEIAGELAPLTTRAAADAVDVFLRYCTGYSGTPPLHLYNDSLHLKTLDMTDSYSPQPGCPACGATLRWPPTPLVGITPSGHKGRHIPSARRESLRAPIANRDRNC
jgi:molybdopterin-synthase adenylyltransferase